MNTDTSLAPDAGDDVDAVSAAADSITPPASWPMLYRRPVVLSSQLHAHWRVRQTGAAFAAHRGLPGLHAGQKVKIVETR